MIIIFTQGDIKNQDAPYKAIDAKVSRQSSPLPLTYLDAELKKRKEKKRKANVSMPSSSPRVMSPRLQTSELPSN